jgi:hypothetical protein
MLGGNWVIRRLAGVVLRPRTVMAELVRRPVWLGTWVFILVVATACGTALLATDVGQQALVDERVRVVEAFGGTVNDATYATLLAHPPWWVYWTSGGRLLLTPVWTLAVAGVAWVVARADAPTATLTQALAIVVHASVVLALGQLVATPLHYVRESLTSPLNLAAILPGMEDGTVPARVFGAIDIFAVWWLALVAIGLSALTGRSARKYVGWFGAVYLGFAVIMAGVIAAVGGR